MAPPRAFRVKLTEFVQRSALPWVKPPGVLGGVYVLAYQDEIVYVGRTRDIAHRLALHRFRNRIRFDSVRFFEVSPGRAALVEGALIRALNPRCCVKAPIDVGRDDEVLAEFGIPRDDQAAFVARQRAHHREVGFRSARTKRADRQRRRLRMFIEAA